MSINRSQIVLGVGSVTLISIAIAIEHPFVSSVLEHGHKSYIFNLHSVVLLLTEIGFALAIALAISAGIERQARERDNLSHDRMRRLIAEDVFKGVFAEGLPRKYVDAVVDRNLRVQVVRPWIRTVINISPSDPKIAGATRLVRCDRSVEFVLENISGRDITEIGKVFGPIRRKSLTDHVGVTAIIINNKEYSTEEIKSFRVIDPNGAGFIYSWPIYIAKGESVEVKLEYTMFKDTNDTDAWSTVYPTLRSEVILRSSVPLHSLGQREPTGQGFVSEYRDAEKGVGNWVIEAPILPNDTVATWWNCN